MFGRSAIIANLKVKEASLTRALGPFMTTALAGIAGAIWSGTSRVTLRFDVRRGLSLRCWIFGHDDWVRRVHQKLAERAILAASLFALNSSCDDAPQCGASRPHDHRLRAPSVAQQQRCERERNIRTRQVVGGRLRRRMLAAALFDRQHQQRFD